MASLFMYKFYSVLDLSDAFGGSDVYEGQTLPTQTCAAEYILNFLSNALLVLIGVMILAAIILGLLAALKIVASLGDAEAVAEAFKSYQNIFIGLIAGFLALVVIYVLINIFWGDPTINICPTGP